MLKPTIGDIVGNISRSLRADVLEELPEGGARRQLKAALHALDRVERCWKELGQTLFEDHRDIVATLRDMLAGLETEGVVVPESFHARLQAAADEVPDPARSRHFLAAQIDAHEDLQALLLEVDPWLRGLIKERAELESYLEDLGLLYRRMVARELAAMKGDDFTAEELEQLLRDAGADWPED